MVLRQRVWVDRNVQGALIERIVLYWISALLYVGLGSACFQYYQHPDWTLFKHTTALFGQFWPWIPSAVLCLPLVMFDVVRLSNLFVGPIYRLRKHLDELCEDPNCRPLKFRDDDYWQDLAQPMHTLQAELQSLRSEVTSLRQLKNNLQNTSVDGRPAASSSAPLDLSQLGQEQVKNLLPALGAASEHSHFAI